MTDSYSTRHNMNSAARQRKHRETAQANGRRFLNVHLPAELIDDIDTIKQQLGLTSRAEFLEIAARSYVEQKVK